MRTSIKEIFAVGDCTVKRDFLTGCYTNLMLASTAIAQGRLVGSNIYNIKVIKQFSGVLGTFSTKILGTAYASVGINEQTAKKANIEIITGEFETVDKHPDKLPDSKKQKVKI
jgi:pyruvate/2-oxoglutarate dehydrogenase complex dihydrolipoamide dehydrogenase (E3) component